LYHIFYIFNFLNIYDNAKKKYLLSFLLFISYLKMKKYEIYKKKKKKKIFFFFKKNLKFKKKKKLKKKKKKKKKRYYIHYFSLNNMDNIFNYNYMLNNKLILGQKSNE